jgi:hypothetical protein
VPAVILPHEALSASPLLTRIIDSPPKSRYIHTWQALAEPHIDSQLPGEVIRAGNHTLYLP